MGFVTMKDHVHPRQCPGSIILFLAIYRKTVHRFVGYFNQQRTGTAGWIVDRSGLWRISRNLEQFSHNTGYLGWRVKLPFTLARFSSKVTHKILISVTQKIVTLSVRTGEIDILKNSDQVAQRILHGFALTQFVGVIEVCVIDYTLQIIFLCKMTNSLINLLANIGLSFESYQIIKGATFRNFDKAKGVTLRLIRYILYEQNRQYVVLILTCVHTATKLISALPQRTI